MFVRHAAKVTNRMCGAFVKLCETILGVFVIELGVKETMPRSIEVARSRTNGHRSFCREDRWYTILVLLTAAEYQLFFAADTHTLKQSESCNLYRGLFGTSVHRAVR